MSVNHFTEIIAYITTYILTWWWTLFAVPLSPDNRIDLKAVQYKIQPLLPHHVILHIPPPLPLVCRIHHVSDGYMIYGISDIEQINCRSNWEV